MTAFKPFPILNFDGLSLEREPWLSPGDAWTVLDNAYIYRGRLHKRPGATWHQRLGVPVTETIGAGPYITGTLANLPFNAPSASAARPITSDKYNVRFVGENTVEGVMTIVVGDVESIVGTVVNYELVDEGTSTVRGYISHGGFLDGFYEVTFPHACDAAACEIQYETVPGRPIMGFTTYVDTVGTEHNLCFDTRRCWKLDESEDWWYVEEPGLGNIWSGDSQDHFWLAPYGDILVINNGVDVPYKYDPTAGTTLTAMATDINNDASDDIDFAKMFFNVRGYPVWLSTQENGSAHLGRARWGVNGNAELYNSPNDYIDAPSNDIIITAGFVAGELYVGFRDVGWWRFEFTGDPISPFAWVPVESYLGAVARNGTVSLANQLISRSRRGFVAVNRMGEQEVAKQLGDLPTEWNPATAPLTQALRYDQARQVWWSFSDGSNETLTSLAVQQQELDGSEQWSIWDLAYNALGSHRTSGALTIDSIPDVIDTLEWRLDSVLNLSGFPIINAGDLTGNVYYVNGAAADSSSSRGGVVGTESLSGFLVDNITPIAMSAKTTRINPFPGVRARLGWVDVMADATDTASLKLRFYSDFENAAYKEVSLDISSATAEKVIRRINVNHTALFHTIEVVDESRAGVTVDYIAPWFQPVGRVRETV